MNLRICSISEEHLNTCVEHDVWGAHGAKMFSGWELGDLLVFKVGNCFAALAKINGEPYLDNTVIWDNGLYYDRIKISFEVVLDAEKRIPFDGVLKSLFLEKWGHKYGWVILNKYPVPDDIKTLICEKFDYHPI